MLGWGQFQKRRKEVEMGAAARKEARREEKKRRKEAMKWGSVPDFRPKWWISLIGFIGLIGLIIIFLLT